MTWTNGIATLHHADARDIPLEDQSVHCVVTSPPYWGLRSYDLEDTGIGLEPTLAEHLDNIVAVGREVWRVLRDDGTFWLNYGDAYSGSWGNYNPTGKGGQRSKETERWDRPAYEDTGRRPAASRPSATGLKPKDLMGLPWRIAFALQDDGWYLRSAIVWHKPNPMPESVRDRPTSAYEMVFLLTKQPRYFYDAEAIRTPSATEPHKPGQSKIAVERFDQDRNERTFGNGMTNARNVWTIPTQGRPDAHFATYPDELPRRCILAGTSERGVCAECGAPWERTIAVTQEHIANQNVSRDPSVGFASDMPKTRKHVETTGWQPTCECNAATVPATVLDPFIGSGTTSAVAQSLGRHSVGLDLNREYLAIAQRRIEAMNLPMTLS